MKDENGFDRPGVGEVTMTEISGDDDEKRVVVRVDAVPVAVLMISRRWPSWMPQGYERHVPWYEVRIAGTQTAIPDHPLGTLTTVGGAGSTSLRVVISPDQFPQDVDDQR